MNNLKYEEKYWNEGINHIAGIDEAGRGPLAGPVVAACVILKKFDIIEGIDDSKKLSPKKRENLYYEIIDNALAIGVGVVHEKEIDEINILEATYLAMRKSIGQLNIKPNQILIDGPRSDIKHYNVEHIIKGDSLSQTIAAASIIAKVYRDKIMLEYDKIFPHYEFKKNKGYGTKKHIDSINKFKTSPIHRKSFKIVNKNFPTYDFIYNNYGFDVLAMQIIASNYIKNNYIVFDHSIQIEDLSDSIDLCFKKNNNYLFIKTIALYSNQQAKVNRRDFYELFIQKYFNEKDIISKIDFIVISVTFEKQNKPIIKIIDIE